MSFSPGFILRQNIWYLSLWVHFISHLVMGTYPGATVWLVWQPWEYKCFFLCKLLFSRYIYILKSCTIWSHSGFFILYVFIVCIYSCMHVHVVVLYFLAYVLLLFCVYIHACMCICGINAMTWVWKSEYNWQVSGLSCHLKIWGLNSGH